MIEFVKDWQAYRAGAVTDSLGGGIVDALKRRGIVRDLATPSPAADKPKQPAARTRSNRR